MKFKNQSGKIVFLQYLINGLIQIEMKAGMISKLTEQFNKHECSQTLELQIIPRPWNYESILEPRSNHTENRLVKQLLKQLQDSNNKSPKSDSQDEFQHLYFSTSPANSSVNTNASAECRKVMLSCIGSFQNDNCKKW